MSLDAYAPEPASAVVFFDRRELDQLLRLYGRQVAAGEWRDSTGRVVSAPEDPTHDPRRCGVFGAAWVVASL